jgi:hypothetical protein
MLGMHFSEAPAAFCRPSARLRACLRADAANQTQLRLVIVDQTGAGFRPPRHREAGHRRTVEFTADDHGVAASPNLVPGTVTVHVEFPGFMPFDAPLTLKRGAMNQTVTLQIEGFKTEVEVSQASAPRRPRAPRRRR